MSLHCSVRVRIVLRQHSVMLHEGQRIAMSGWSACVECSCMDDTSPKIAAMVRQMLLAHSGAERVAMGSQMFEVARTMMLASFPPGLSDIEIKLWLCRRLYGNQVDLAGFSKKLNSRQEIGLAPSG